MDPQPFKTAYTPAGQNANNDPWLNLLGMQVEVKIALIK